MFVETFSPQKINWWKFPAKYGDFCLVAKQPFATLQPPFSDSAIFLPGLSDCTSRVVNFVLKLCFNLFDKFHTESEKADCKVAKVCFATRQKSPDLINLAGNFHQLVFFGGKGLPKHDFSCMKNSSEQDSLKFYIFKTLQWEQIKYFGKERRICKNYFLC